jgi:hypothetical protein
MNYFVEKMAKVKVIDVVETTGPNFQLIDLLVLLFRFVAGVVVNEIEDSNEDLVHVVDELISMNED